MNAISLNSWHYQHSNSRSTPHLIQPSDVTPFEAGHGYNATTISEARVMATKAAILVEGGRDGDALEDVNEYFDKSIIKDQFELAMRMAELARSTSEWHRRMTSENLG